MQTHVIRNAEDLNAVLNHIFGRFNGDGPNGSAPKSAKPKKPRLRQIVTNKYAVFITIDRMLTAPRLVKSRDVKKLTDIPEDAVGCFFYNELATRVRDGQKQVLLTSDEPSRVSPVYFFRAIAGSHRELAQRGLLDSVLHAQARALTTSKLVIAEKHGCLCGSCRVVLPVPPKAPYEIVGAL